MSEKPACTVVHNVAASRFETTVEGLLAVADYELRPGASGARVMAMTHTVVPRALEGRGIAAQLVAAALEHARQQGFKVDPVCSYVAAYMQRKPQTHDLRVP